MKKQKKVGFFEHNIRLNKLSLLILLFASFSTLSQVDELKKKYPKQKGEERVMTLLDICFYQATSNNTEAIRFGKMAEFEAKKIGDSALLATVWNDWSIPYFYKGNLDSSLLLNKKALNYRTKLKDTLGMAKSLNKIANTYYEMGVHDKSLQAHFKSLRYFKQEQADQFLCQVYTNIGNIYDRINNSEKALYYHSLSIQEALKFENKPAEAIARINKANSLRELGRYNDSKNEYHTVLPLLDELEMIEHKAGVYQGLGVIERESENVNGAIDYYEKALTYYRKANTKGGISLVLVNLGNCYTDKKQYDQAENYLQEGLKLALETKSYYNIRHAYKFLMRLENLKGNYKAADAYFTLYIENMDSIYNDNSTQALAEMQVKYDTEQKELELAQQKIKTKNATIWLLVFGVFTVVLIAVSWYFAQKKRIEKKNAELQNIRNLEKERIRIARDLHDNLGAELTMITSKIDAKAFRSTNLAEQQELNELGTISRNANFVLRETIWSIHKEILTIDELVSKTKEYGQRIFANSPIQFHVHGEEETNTLSPAIALHLFRIIQEAVNNAFKYASCSEVIVTIKSHEVCIQDNGIGFDFETVKKGYGLQNIEVRVNEMNGSWSIQTKQGTEIRIAF